MSGEQRDQSDEVARYLGAAAKAIGSIRFCWLATTSKSGFAEARPMGRTPAGAR